MRTPILLSALGLYLASPLFASPQGPASATPIHPAAAAATDPDARDAHTPARRPGAIGAPVSVTKGAFGVSRTGEGLIGGGPDYEIVFDTDGFTFIPVLSPDAPKNMPLRFAIESVARRDAAGVGFDVAPTEPTLSKDQRTVRYHRTGYVETYETRADGVEQSFVFDALPPGKGDLVVRGRIQTDLLLTHAASDGLRFEAEGIGGVTFGAVTGIDAAGNRVRGTIRFAGDQLELALPTQWIDDAALPLVLDPLIGSVYTVASANDNERPDICYDDNEIDYLVVWQRRFSQSSRGIRAQLLEGDGSLKGGLIVVRSGVFLGSDPAVGFVTYNGRYFVAWEEANDIMGAWVSGDSGIVSNVGTVATGGINHSPDVGGEQDYDPIHREALVVWANSTNDQIRAAQVQYSFGNVIAFDTTTLASGGSVTEPAITLSGGDVNRWLVAWTHGSSSTIRGAVIDRDITFVDSFVQISSSGGQSESQVAIDGDGTNWIAAYTATEPLDNDVAARGITFDPATGHAYVTPEVMVEDDPLDPELVTGVAWARTSAIVAFADRDNLGYYDAYIKSVDPFDCTSCEGEFVLDLGPTTNRHMALVNKRSQGSNSDDLVIVWESSDTSTNEGEIDAVVFEAESGYTWDNTGGCGDGGTPMVGCAIVGHSGFDLRLQHAASAKLAWVVMSPDWMPLVCGSCRLNPSLLTGVVASAGATDSRGNASVTLDIPANPSLSGALFYAQWAIEGTQCSSLDLSDTMRVLIN